METATSRDICAPFYASHGITLYCATFEQILPQLADRTFDGLITDPPYGTTNIEWDRPVDWKLFWQHADRICKPKSPQVLFSSGKFTNQLINSNAKHFRYELIWEKNNPVGFLDANRRPLRSHENILIFSQIYKGATYNPQMIEGKPHVVGKGNRAAHYGQQSGRTVERTTNLYHPRSILRIDPCCFEKRKSRNCRTRSFASATRTPPAWNWPNRLSLKSTTRHLGILFCSGSVDHNFRHTAISRVPAYAPQNSTKFFCQLVQEIRASVSVAGKGSYAFRIVGNRNAGTAD